MNSVYFSVGLGLGFTLGISVGLACWFLATKAAETKYKGKITQLQQTAAVHRQNLDQEVKRITELHGSNASVRHREILQEELAAVITKRPQRT